ncbi:MAG: ABC transporter ATP-binding protein [Flavobacteriia bacterium]|nr:ABC transporter ATP-binding protein [Flavobacteriia bacterium]
MKPILEISNLSKRFKINSEQQPYLSLRDSFSNLFKKANSKLDFWALNDLSFNVEEGDTVGIIGKNGAGKSTLLKVLSKITPPTSGQIISRGRIASLLEVGTGFHPELTGRENVYMNGSILGMRNTEIKKNFDAIVDFAGIERFIDTPLKHYSSGMQLRLAFAVAAFLENEILIIDEVLAVGDAEFQKKCMGKMSEVSKSGRTILFVSHNMGAIKQLCKKSVFLKQGELISYGESNSVLQMYSSSDAEGFDGIINCESNFINRIELYCDNIIQNVFYSGSRFKLKLYFESKELIISPVLGVIIRDEYDQAIVGINNKNYESQLRNFNNFYGCIEMEIPFLPLYVGRYYVDVHFGDAYIDLDVKRNLFSFVVEKNGINNALEMPNENYNKILIEKVNWKISDEHN